MVPIVLFSAVLAAAIGLALFTHRSVGEAVGDLRGLVQQMVTTLTTYGVRLAPGHGNVHFNMDLPELVPYSKGRWLVLADAGPCEVLPRTQVVDPEEVARFGLTLNVLAPDDRPAEVAVTVYDARTMTPLARLATAVPTAGRSRSRLLRLWTRQGTRR